MLMNLDISRENIADDEEIQELYRSCMVLRPRIVKLTSTAKREGDFFLSTFLLDKV